MWKSSGSRRCNMKTARTPIWPLVRIELRIGVTPPMLLFPWASDSLSFVWIFFGVLPLTVLTRLCRGNIAEFFTLFGNLLCLFPAWWLMLAVVLNGRIFPELVQAYSPIASDSPGGGLLSPSHEYLFSRGIDRRTLFRVRQGVVLLLMLTPLVVGCLLSHRSDVVFAADTPDGLIDPVRARQDKWALLGLTTKTNSSVVPLGSFLIDNGGQLLGGWILSAGIIGMFLAQGFCAFLARHIRPGRWTLATLLCVPFLLTWVLLDHPQSWQATMGGRKFSAIRGPLAFGVVGHRGVRRCCPVLFRTHFRRV